MGALEDCLRYIRLISPLLATGTLVWCLFVGWWIWTTPVRYVGVVSDPENPDRSVQAEKYERFEDVSALGAIPLVIPVILAGLATLTAFGRAPMILLTLGIALLAYGFVTGFSIGRAYMPAGRVLILAACIAAASPRGR